VAVVGPRQVVEVGGAVVEGHRHRPRPVDELILDPEEGLGEPGVVLHVATPALEPVEPEDKEAKREAGAEARLAAGIHVPEDVPAGALPRLAGGTPRFVGRLDAVAELDLAVTAPRHPGPASVSSRRGEHEQGEHDREAA
jgi:hypothetical protein